MTIKDNLKALVAMLFLPWAVMSCSDDSNDEKYRSEPPRFSDISVRPLNTTEQGSDGDAQELYTGQRLLVTAHQSAIGRLLYKAVYSWTASPSDGVSHLYSQNVVYDNNSVDPTDTIIVNNAGTYSISLTAKYYASGQVTSWGAEHSSGFTESFADGNGSVTYSLSGILYFTVNASKTFTVKTAP